MYVKSEMITPANRNSNSQVTNIAITSPLREGKKNLRSRQREATATVLDVLWVTVLTATVFYFITLFSACQEKNSLGYSPRVFDFPPVDKLSSL